MNKKKLIALVLATLAFFVALGATVYPIVSTWYGEQHRSEIHTQYQEQIEKTDNEELKEAKKLAQAYNAALIPGSKEVEAFSKEAVKKASENYGSLLNIAGDGIMSYVNIPIINVKLPVYHGTTDSTLEIGAGHLLGSSLPVGGENTHSVITAHSGMASSKMFSDLTQLEIGDVFYLETLGETLAYEVDQIETVLPHETALLGVYNGEDYCTLITCTPFGINTHRLLVRGTRIPYDPEAAVPETTVPGEEVRESNWEQQYINGLLIGLAVTVAGLALLVIGYSLYSRFGRSHEPRYAHRGSEEGEQE